MILEKLIKLLQSIDNQKNNKFEGIGLIVYSSIENLPITPINKTTSSLRLPKENLKDILNILLDISTNDSDFHDGFHLISKEFKLTHLSQYFSTPIIENLNIQNQYGSRYRTALYGSFLPNVLYTAVLSKNYGPFIFKRGEIIEIKS